MIWLLGAKMGIARVGIFPCDGRFVIPGFHVGLSVGSTPLAVVVGVGIMVLDRWAAVWCTLLELKVGSHDAFSAFLVRVCVALHHC